MRTLSSPATALGSRCEVLVIGSGYGGAIAASRLARAGRQVWLLERGREFVLGSFPDTLSEFASECQLDAPKGQLGARSGLYDFRINPDLNVLKGCGLGGTSLINAGVAIEAEPRVFEDSRWPTELRGRPQELDEGYRLARTMLGSNPYPQNWPALPKLAAQEASARRLGAPLRRADINVSFSDGPNAAGVQQSKCTLCGDCVSGCNYGAKNTLMMNYLPDAVNWGAQLFSEVEVRYLEQRGGGGGWRVFYRPLGSGREAFGAPDQFLDAELVILAAGSLGSSEILLRSREHGLALSDKLGHSFTGNGDVLGFAYNCDQPIDGVGWGQRSRADVQHPDVGPCITSVIDLREQPVLDDGMVIEEGVVPGLARSALPAALAAASALVGHDTDGGLADEMKEFARQTLSLVTAGAAGAVRNTQTYLVMAHDGSAGQLKLADDRLRVHWPGAGKGPIFERIDAQLRKATEALGGTYVKNPMWTRVAGHDLITVHPLGGCPMADAAEAGVVNHRGQVFSSARGSAVYAGLLVCDGSIVPRSLGTNPLLTISALSERAVAQLAATRGWTIDYGARAQREAQRAPSAVGVQFTETMKGFIAAGAADYAQGHARGMRESSSFAFTLTVRSDDLEAMLHDPRHRAAMSGSALAPSLSAAPLTASEGEFELFCDDPARTRVKQMRYRMRLTSQEGRSFAFSGYKEIRDGAGFDLWSDTTTLYVTLEEQGGAKSVLARGILRIELADFARQMTTLRALHARGGAESARALARFGKFFLGELWSTYGKALAPSEVFDPSAPPRKRRDLRLPTAEVIPLRAEDGAALRLTRLRAGSKGPVLLAPGMGTSTQAFTLDTVDVSLAEYLAAHGYDIWLFDYRASSDLPVSRTQFSLDTIAQYDYPAALAAVRESSGAESVQVVAHCVASATLFMSLLGGHAQHVRSFVASQFTPFIETTPLIAAKSGLRLPALLQAFGVDVLSTEFDTHSSFSQQAYDALLRLYPTQAGQLCDSPVCRRIRFMWGEVFLHENLNHATHAAVHEFFGDGNLTLFAHLAAVIRAKKLVSADGSDAYLPNLKRLALPISFMQGSKNSLFLPSASQGIFEKLVSSHGAELYRRQVFEGYAHMDCFIGARAHNDVYPFILGELERWSS